MLALDFAYKYASENVTGSLPSEHLELGSRDISLSSSSSAHVDVTEVDGRVASLGPQDSLQTPTLPTLPIREENTTEGESGEVELGGLFSDDAPADELVASEVLRLQKKERMRELCSEKNLDGIWRKVMPDCGLFVVLFKCYKIPYQVMDLLPIIWKMDYFMM